MDTEVEITVVVTVEFEIMILELLLCFITGTHHFCVSLQIVFLCRSEYIFDRKPFWFSETSQVPILSTGRIIASHGVAISGFLRFARL